MLPTVLHINEVVHYHQSVASLAKHTGSSSSVNLPPGLHGLGQLPIRRTMSRKGGKYPNEAENMTYPYKPGQRVR